MFLSSSPSVLTKHATFLVISNYFFLFTFLYKKINLKKKKKTFGPYAWIQLHYIILIKIKKEKKNVIMQTEE